MIISEIITLVLLSVLLFWTAYNGAIIYVGVRNMKKRQVYGQNAVDVEALPRFSVIVPTMNEMSVIGRCLDGLLSVDYPKNKLQVLVVDGNSNDGTCQVCSEYEHKYPETFKVICEQTVRGKPAALNTALSHVNGEIVAVFDADSVLEKDVFLKAASYFGDVEVVGLQGRTTSVNAKSSLLTRVIAMEEQAWYQMLLSGREKLRLFVPLNGTCQFVRRAVLDEMGGWDENSLTEDVELALRLVEQNHLVKYAPDVCSGQETPNTLGGLVKQRTRWYRGYMETAIKYGRLLSAVNKRTVDAEISMGGPFMMVISLLSYVNWFLVAVFLSFSTPLLNFTGLVIALTAVSLFSIGLALTASEKPIKKRNILWAPTIYAYWMLQMFIAFWAFLLLVFRRKRVWTKTLKDGSFAPGDDKKQSSLV